MAVCVCSLLSMHRAVIFAIGQLSCLTGSCWIAASGDSLYHVLETVESSLVEPVDGAVRQTVDSHGISHSSSSHDCVCTLFRGNNSLLLGLVLNGDIYFWLLRWSC